MGSRILLAGLLAVFPLVWMVAVSLMRPGEASAFPPPLLPGGNFLDNARRVLDTTDFWSAMLNSLIVSSACAASAAGRAKSGSKRSSMSASFGNSTPTGRCIAAQRRPHSASIYTKAS